MIIIGQILIALGFLVGTVSTAFDKEMVNWPMFGAAMAIGVVGIIMAAVGRKRSANAEETLTANLGAIGSALDALAEKARELDAAKEDIFVYDFHEKIDAMFPLHLDNFVAARESVIHAYSMNDYADLMNHFAAGERTINRVWSASVDGYIDEVKQCLTKAAGHFRDAASLYKELEARKT